MAVYKYAVQLQQSNHQAFDDIYPPAARTPHSGIYSCTRCGMNEVSTYGHPLPPQDHHQHPVQLGPIQWRLIVATK